VGPYVLRRLVQSAVLLLVVSMATFTIIHKAPGMPAVLVNPDGMSREELVRARANLGLDDPIAVQYVRWLGNAVRGKLGSSYQLNQPVLDLILQRLPASLLLSGTALLLAVLVAIPLGVVSAVRPYGAVDHAATLVSLLGISVPVFWFGIMMIILFSVKLGVLPSGGMFTLGSPPSLSDRGAHLLMPALVLSTIPGAQLMRYTRSSVRSVLAHEYLKVARGKGLRESVVLRRHALRNAMIPIVTVFGLLLPATVSGAPVTESIFAWPGMGRLAVDAAFQRDYPVVMGVTLAVSVMVITCNLLVDVAYAYLDPRIKLG
jgi:peptide/nickel transport system permease protein